MMNPFFRNVALVAAAFVLSITASTCYAVLIAYDGFDYAAGTDNLDGQNGGTGWTAGWGPSSGGISEIQSPGATYTTLDTVGNKAFISASNQNARVLTTGNVGTGDSSVWLSFIGQRVGVNNIRFFGLSFYEGGTASTQERLTIGENSNNNNDQWGAHFTSAAAGRVDVAGTAINTQSLLLARIDYHSAANDDFYLWVNPDLSSGEPALGTAGASSVGAFNLAFDRVSMRAGTDSGGNIGQAYYDEIRIGTSFADVAPGAAGLLPGDTDGDGTPGEFPDDFEPIRANFRRPVSMRSQGDLVPNGLVDFADFREWKVAFLGGGGSLEGLNLNFLSVPEPSSTGLALLAVFVATAVHRARRHEMRSFA